MIVGTAVLFTHGLVLSHTSVTSNHVLDHPRLCLRPRRALPLTWVGSGGDLGLVAGGAASGVADLAS